jgi:hypothetical protein
MKFAEEAVFWSNRKFPSWSVNTARSFKWTSARATGAPVIAFTTRPATVVGMGDVEAVVDPVTEVLEYDPV